MSDKKDYSDVFASDDEHGQVDHFSEADAFSNESEDVDPFGMPADSEQDIYAPDDESHQEYYAENMGMHEDNPKFDQDTAVHFDSPESYSAQEEQAVPQKKSSSKLKAAIAVGLFGLVSGAGMLFLLDGGQPAPAPMMMGDAGAPQGQMQFNQGVPSASQDDINRLAAQLDPNQLRQMDAQAFIEDTGADEANPLSILTGGSQNQNIGPSVSSSQGVENIQSQMGQPVEMPVTGGMPQSEQSMDMVTNTPNSVLSVMAPEDAGSVMDLVNTLTGYVDNNSVRINEIERRISSTENRMDSLKDEILSEIAATRAINEASSVTVASRTSVQGSDVANNRNTETSVDGYYTVTSGDNLSMIARRFNISTDSLAENNGIINQSLIFVGQRLRVDGEALSQSQLQRNRARTQSVASSGRSASPRSLSQWKIAGLSPSRAVLIDNKGQYHTVSVGETISGGGRVESIDVASNRVVTSTGVIQFIQ